MTKRSESNAMAPKTKKRLPAPSSSCRIICMNKFDEEQYLIRVDKISQINLLCDSTCNGEKAKVTRALEPKLVRTARLIPRPLVRIGKISDTISQLIGPKDTYITFHAGNKFQ